MKQPPPTRRTPKVKEFVSAPFIECPDCGEQKFGVLIVGRDQYSRRCTNCWFDARFPLPKLNKRVIYLDQFVISNMMKELDPTTPASQRGAHSAFFRELFEELDKTCKLQLAVCPESRVHEFESVVTGPHFEKLREVFRHLSYEVRFRSPESVYHRQVYDGFSSWLNRQPVGPQTDRIIALDGDLTGWTDRIRIDLNYTTPGLADELKTSLAASTKHLHEICRQWKNDPHFSFKKVFEDEVLALGNSALKSYFRHLEDFVKASNGELPIATVAFPHHDVSMMQMLLSQHIQNSTEPAERLAQVYRFFCSKEFRKLPYVKVWGLFWATLARVVHSGMSEDNFPSGSIYNDLDVVAAYSPYCDAMFLDVEMDSLTRQGDLGRYLTTGAKIFSLRTKNEFLAYLRQLQSSASAEHIQLVKEVYGPNADRPFVELLTRRKSRP